MKTLPLLLALAITAPAFSQDAAPAEKPSPAPAAEKPAPAAEKPAPAKPAQSAPELPPLPDPAPGTEQADILRNQPGGRLTPAPVPVPGSRKVSNPERIPGRTTLKPPATSEDLDRRIRYREARTRAEADPKLRAMWEESRTVATDFEKRALLKDYFKALYAKMLASDKSLEPLIELRRRVALRRLDQTRIDPTDPIEDEARIRPD